MSRRQTLAPLAPLSPSQLNSKAGNNGAPGRCPKDGGAQPTKGRKSVVPGLPMDRAAIAGAGIERRSSVVGPKASGPKQDPRQLNKKESQNKWIENIISYLSTHGYNAVITHKNLASPTGKEFLQIISFLFQQIDPSLKFQTKVEDEVLLVFKRLNYPFPISKSALVAAVGAPHSWPAVLAALSWLVDLLKYSENANRNGHARYDREGVVDYLAKCYHAFLAANDDRCDELDSEFVAKYHRKNEELSKEADEIVRERELLAAELTRLRSLRDPVDVSVEQRKQQEADKEKLEQLVQQDQGIKESQQRKVAEKKADLQAKQDQIAAMKQDVDQIRQRVAGQTVNKADVHRFVMERNKQHELLAAEKSRCEEQEMKNHELGLHVQKVMTDMESLAEHYSTLANRLKLIPLTGKRAGGTNFELRLVRTAISQVEFSNLDLKGVIKPKLESLCEEYLQRAGQLQQDLVSLREACTARAEGSAEKQEEHNYLLAEIAKHEAQLQAAKDAVEEKCRKLAAQAESVRGQVEEFQSVAINRNEKMEEQLARAQLAFEQAKRDAEAELAKVDADLKQSIQMLVSHKEYMTKTVMKVAGFVRQTANEIVEMHRRQLPNFRR